MSCKAAEGIIRRYRENNYILRAPEDEPAPRPSKLDPIRDILLNTEVLRLWKTLSCAQRVENIAQTYHIDLTPTYLAYWYRRHNIRYLRPPFRTVVMQPDAVRRRLQLDTCLKLMAHWGKRHELVFIDESSSNAWHTSYVKTWQRSD